MRSEQLKAAIVQVDSVLEPLLKQKAALGSELRDALSIEWIAANSITWVDVITPDDKGMPYFGHIQSFVKYLQGRHCEKRWAAWNGTLYSLAELMAGKMDPNAPGKVEHLKP